MVMSNLKRVAVLTSGGDAPGMNAAIRAVVRTALAHGIEPMGVMSGYAGLVEGHFRPLDSRAVSGIVQQGGTVLHSARCPAFGLPATQHQAVRYLEEAGIEALIVIGGNGSQQGTLTLHRLGFPVVGIASTIDNDLAQTETTIGADTALNTAVAYIDKLRDTATSHHRAFIIEVMGRDSGYLAVMTAIATGAEMEVVPEHRIDPETIAQDVQAAYGRGKTHYIVVVAEGAALKAWQLTDYLRHHASGVDARLSVLGHVQRGGSPTVRDRVLASQFGAAAVQSLLEGHHGIVIGVAKDQIVEIPLEAAIALCEKVTPELLALAGVLSH
jgi:6-phosphofructokinase 1